ncbi:META domain-containing protein [Streptomyces sp. AK02-01A]|uniref:META domain-containing protein n=1 Tax=Streptomyces sp. AK02-01A TaxID=3028648 RepID=UPI0029A701D6|nr:META domain-containing protein [Streptomyces sp. AK02-01A]MDX3855017.1 META domain-containing protein [Streptomyces sp. AK02-01A]
MQKQQIITVTAVALLTLAACGTDPGSGSGGGGGSVRTGLPLTDVRWNVDSVTVGGKKTAAPAGASVEIGTEGRASARTGCNSIGADVTVDGDTITVGDKRSTLIGCPEKLKDFEKALNGAFSGKLKAEVDDKRLTLTTAGGDSIALTSEPPAPLAGTEWTVNALVAGATAKSLPGGTDGKAYFTLRNGSVEGSLGCNRFSGPVEISGSTVTFGRISATRKLCPGPEMTLERQVQKVLEGKVTYDLHHRGLTLTTPDGQGLSAVAAPSGK